MANERTRARIASRIKERAAYCIEHELNDPRTHFITITEVEVSSDLTSASLRYSVLGTPAQRRQVEQMMTKAAGFIQRQVGRVLQTRTVPRLTFYYDDSLERAAAMDAAIQAALNKDRKVNPSAHAEIEIKDVVVHDDLLDGDSIDSDSLDESDDSLDDEDDEFDDLEDDFDDTFDLDDDTDDDFEFDDKD